MDEAGQMHDATSAPATPRRIGVGDVVIHSVTIGGHERDLQEVERDIHQTRSSAMFYECDIGCNVSMSIRS